MHPLTLAAPAATPAPASSTAPVADAAPAETQSVLDQATRAVGDIEKYIETVAPQITEYGVRFIGVIVIFFVAWALARWARRTVYATLTRAKFDETLKRFLANLARWVIIILTLVTCLGVFGVNTTSFAAIIGAAGLAVGLAFQGSLSNLAAGIMILIFRPFKVGDLINVGGQLGKVDDIELFSTKLDTLDNRRLIVPNTQLFTGLIENITHHPHRRADIAVGTSYSADIDAVRTALESAIRNTTGALTDPAPQVFLKGFGASAVEWDVRVWAKSTEFGDVRQSLVRAIKLALDKAQISIPFPQMDVNFRTPLATVQDRTPDR